MQRRTLVVLYAWLCADSVAANKDPSTRPVQEGLATECPIPQRLLGLLPRPLLGIVLFGLDGRQLWGLGDEPCHGDEDDVGLRIRCESRELERVERSFEPMWIQLSIVGSSVPADDMEH